LLVLIFIVFINQQFFETNQESFITCTKDLIILIILRFKHLIIA